MYLKCLTLMLLAALSQTMRLGNYQGSITPRIFKIIEKDNKIVLERTVNQKFDKRAMLKFLHKNANLEYRMNNILQREEDKSGVKKRWIKRIVPHSQETPNVAYDERFGLSYRPIVRLHKTKTIHLENKNSIPKLATVQSDLDDLIMKFNLKAMKNSVALKNLEAMKNLEVIKNLETMKNSIQHEKTYTKEAGHVMRHMKAMDQIIGIIGVPYLSRNIHKILKRHHNKIAPIIEEMHAEILRYITREGERLLRSGAPLIEEKIANQDNNIASIDKKTKDRDLEDVLKELYNINEEVEELPAPMFPHVPLWNQWTYKQSLLQDECPKGQVKIGSICCKRPVS